VATELVGHNRPEVQEAMRKNFSGIEPIGAQDIANAIVFAIGQPQNVSINELLVRPTSQAR
jgi:NADP-dependent 3-hydroxy acid dehydrogenase YdfG